MAWYDAPPGPYGLVNLWETLPQAWADLCYASVFVRIDGLEWIIRTPDGDAIVVADHWRRNGYSCSCGDEDNCTHIRSLRSIVAVLHV